MYKRSLKFVVFLLVLSLPLSAAQAEGEHIVAVRNLVDTQIKTWIGQAVLIDAIKAQNAANANLSQAEIDKLDKQWRTETGADNKPLINKVMARRLSAFLIKEQEKSQGLYTEIFVMDNKGLNVGQSAVTSDYWQGDEAKWKKTYGAGAGAVHISEVEQDESTQTFQSQLSLAISDPAGGSVIGAVTIGVDVGILLQ